MLFKHYLINKAFIKLSALVVISLHVSTYYNDLKCVRVGVVEPTREECFRHGEIALVGTHNGGALVRLNVHICSVGERDSLIYVYFLLIACNRIKSVEKSALDVSKIDSGIVIKSIFSD